MDLDGRLDPDATVELLNEDIEGITLDPGGAFLYAVREKGNEILQVDLGGRKVVARRRPEADGRLRGAGAPVRRQHGDQ